jgi:hypothetical protein
MSTTSDDDIKINDERIVHNNASVNMARNAIAATRHCDVASGDYFPFWN